MRLSKRFRRVASRAGWAALLLVAAPAGPLPPRSVAGRPTVRGDLLFLRKYQPVLQRLRTQARALRPGAPTGSAVAFDDPLRPYGAEIDPLATPSVPNNTLRPLSPDRWPGFTDDMDAGSMREALRANELFLSRFPGDTVVHFGSRQATVGLLRATHAAFDALIDLPAAARLRILKRDFEVFESVGSDGKGRVVFTGYFEPTIPGFLSGGPPTAVPVLSRPHDLVKTERTRAFPYDYARRTPAGGLVPYYDRAQIDTGALAGRGLQLGWAADAADLLFLQTQGSGWMNLPYGKTIHLGFAGANGRPFRSVASYLIRRGEIARGSNALAVQEYIKSQPEARKREILRVNPRYIFFRVLPSDRGPTGTIGAPLTGGRSMATGKGLPLGCLVYLSTRRPVIDDAGRHTGFAPLKRFALSQDTGSALTGPGRVDVFWGAGTRAAGEASRMKASGKLYYFLLKPAALRTSNAAKDAKPPI